MKPVRRCATKSHFDETAWLLTPSASELHGLLSALHVPLMNNEREASVFFFWVCVCSVFAETETKINKQQKQKQRGNGVGEKNEKTKENRN